MSDSYSELSIEPLEKNWSDDRLQRYKSADFLTQYLLGHYASHKESTANGFVLNVNASWGFGKTFFLERWAQDLKDRKYPVVFFNAWENDFSAEPMAVFLDDVETQLSPFLNRDNKAKKKLAKTMAAAKGLLKPSVPLLLSILVKKLTNESIENFEATCDLELPTDEVSGAVAGLVSTAAEQMIVESKKTKQAIKLFKTNLEQLIRQMQDMESVELPLFIFVDELDRCRPDFSVKFLEIVKHLFGINGVYFVIATDTGQLGASIKALYGESFDSDKYLHRFFDQEFSLPEPTHNGFSKFLLSKMPANLITKLYCPLDESIYPQVEQPLFLFSLFSQYFKMDLRGQERAYGLLEAVVTSYNGKKIYLPWLLYLIMIRVKSREIFDVIKPKGFNLNEINKQVSDIDVDITARYYQPPERGSRKEMGLISLIFPLQNHFQRSLVDIQNDSPSGYAEQRIMNYFHLIMPSEWQGNNPPQHGLKGYLDMVAHAGYLHSTEG